MIHEGPLLEYAGRDLAYLQWAAAARHWLVLVLAAQVFLPHPREVWSQLALLPLVLVVLCAALALVETLVAKMRILLVPRLLAAGAIAALLGVASWLVELLVSGAVVWTLVALGLAVVVVRRRSLAVALVTAQALVLVGFALRRGGRAAATSSRPARSPLRAVVLAALFLLLVSRTREVRPVRARVAPLARAGIAVALRARA